MNGIKPDFIRGMKMFRFQFFRFKSYQNWPLFSPGTTADVHVRLYNTNSILDLIKSSPVQEEEGLEENSPKKNADQSKCLATFVINELKRGENIKNIIKELSSDSKNVENIGLLLFKNIAKLKNVTPEKRTELAGEVLDAFRSLKITITEEHYLGLLDCYSLNKSFPDFDKFLSKMKKDGLQPLETLQQEISKCLSKLGKHKELLKLVKHLKSAGVEISDSLYRDCISCCAATGKIAEAEEEHRKLLETDRFNEKDLLVSFLRGLILHGDENALRDKLGDITDLGLQFSEDDKCTLFELILECEHVHLLPHMINAVGEDINDIFLCVIKRVMQEKEIDKIFYLLSNIYSIKRPLTLSNYDFPTSFYKTVIDHVVESQHSFSDILNKCKELRKIDECHYVLEYLLFKCLKEENIYKSVKVIEALAECGATIEQNYFWPLFIQARKRFGVEGVIQVVYLMFSAGVYPESGTLLKYVFPSLHPYHFFKYFKILSMSGRFYQFLTEVFVIYALENNFEKECAFLLRKRPLNSEVSYYFLEKPFMKALTTKKINQDVIRILKWTNAVDPFTVLKELWSMGEEDRMRELLKFLNMEKVPGVNHQVGGALLVKPSLPADIKDSIRTLMTLKPKTRPPGIEIEKESLYECLEIIRNAEIHAKELESKKMNVSGELFRLLKYYMKVGLYVQALKIRDQLLKNIGPQIELSPTYLSCMCRLYEYEQKYEEALHFYRLVREKYPDFFFDVPKITGLSILFIKVGAFDDLFDLLERMPTWWGNLTLIEHKMVGILKGVAMLGDPKTTQDVFDVLLRKKVIAPTENTLQPFIETYLRKGDTDEAVRELTRLIDKYGRIPSVMLLVWSLVMKREFDKMEETIKKVMRHSCSDERIVISTLRTIACLGDVQILDNYFKKFGIFEDDKRLPHVLRWEYFGGEIDVRMKAFETFILNAKNLRTKLFYADFAAEHACFERNRVVAEKLIDFFVDQRILEKYVVKLKNIIQLTRAFGHDAPSGIPKKKVTIWWESIA